MLYSMGLDLDAILPRATRDAGDAGRRRRRDVLRLPRPLRLGRAVRDDVVRTAAHGDRHTLGGDHDDRPRPLRAATYDAEALQVYNRRARGGIYWFRSGWNPRATALLGAGSGSRPDRGLDPASYEGPLLGLTGGVDCSFVLSGLVGGASWLLLGLGPARVPEREPEAEVAVS